MIRVREDKDYSFRDDIWDLVDGCCEKGMVPDCSLPANTAIKGPRVTKGKVVLTQFLNSDV